MAGEKTATKPEIASQKRVVKLPPAIGDWTTYKPSKVLVKKVKSGLYGFDRLSKEDLKNFFKIHYRFFQSLINHIKFDLKASVELFSCENEQTNYLSFVRTITGPVLQAKISLPNIHEGVQAFFDLNFAHSFVNHALGSQDTEPLSRGLTETEKVIFETAFTQYLPDYTASFDGVITNPSFEVVSSPDISLDPSINLSMTFVVFTIEIQSNNNPLGKISFGYLGSTIKELLNKYKQKEKAKPINFGRLSSFVLGKVSIPVSATIGVTTLGASELNTLEVGDVISTSTSISSAIVLNLGNAFKLSIQPGIKDKKRSAKILGFNEEDFYLPPPIEKSTEPVKKEEPAPHEVIEPEIQEPNLLEDKEIYVAQKEQTGKEETVLEDDELDLEETAEEEDFSDEDFDDLTLDETEQKEDK
ncbi:MAG: FliM/FliN family flagellar motor switch protein [Candidatus Margulisiibacteriota bacterium]